MSVSKYRLQVLDSSDFQNIYTIDDVFKILKAWRNDNSINQCCTTCGATLFFLENFAICCNKFYFKPCDEYIVCSLTVDTPDVHFLSPTLRQYMEKNGLPINQSFLVLPDPIYWQLSTTLIYEKVLHFISKEENFLRCKLTGKGSFHTNFPEAGARLQQMYKKLENAPLYYSSLTHRSQGKETFFRKAGIAKRAEKTARAMIVPAPHLRPNEVVLPRFIDEKLKVLGKWVIVNRMPSLSPDNFVALFVKELWDHTCIGIPCEILVSLGADFDGDEVNLWPVESLEAQSECDFILNSRNNMRSFNRNLKLCPSQDMIVAYYPYGNIFDVLRFAFDIGGSEICFEWFDQFRKFYLYATENIFSNSITLKEFYFLAEMANNVSFEEFEHRLNTIPHKMGCLETQVRSGAKGTMEHLYMLIGPEESFLKGLTPQEYMKHAKSGYIGLINSAFYVWQPGYNYFKLSNNLHNLIIDYNGRILDGDTVLCNDALEQVYHEDLVSTETFHYLFKSYFPSNNLANIS